MDSNFILSRYLGLVRGAMTHSIGFSAMSKMPQRFGRRSLPHRRRPGSSKQAVPQE